MNMNSKRAVFGVLAACLALGLAAAGCGDKFSTDKCKDLPEASVCAGAGLQRCGATSPEVCAPNADGCLVWSAGVPCAAGQTCSEADGQCRCSNTCSAVGGTECNGTVIRTCTADAGGCLAWVNGEDCAAGGQVCDEGSGAAQCAATCTDACSPAGTRRCATGVIQGCGQEASGCLGWIDLQDCAAEDASCVVVDGEPTCAENCQDECVAAEYPQCDVANNARLTCSTQIDGCTDLVTTPCGAGNVCDPALDPPACVLDCTGQCTLGETACGADGFSLDVCSAVADACNAVVNTPCEANQICDATAVPPVCIACTPDCAGKVCGPDGCGGECGPGCVLPQVCNADGTACEGCVPDCAGKVCGDDGCGGSCGSCGADETCAEDQASCDCTGGPDAIVDGSFETGGTWTEYSSAYGTPLCTYPGCGQSNVAVEGVYWIWMGGGDADDAYVEQAVTIPAANIATLWFYLYAGGATAGDFFEVTLDGTQVVQYAVEDPIYGETWHLMEVDVSAYADGAAHTLRLHGTVSAGGSVMLDVVQLITCAGGGCTNDCNPALFPACNANGNLDTCVMQGDGCTDLFSTPCEAGLSCQGAAGSAECLAGCADDCVAANFPACAADLLAIETCADTDADGCTELTTTACNAGEACELVAGVPTCVVGCADDCVAANFPACSADFLAIETCADTDADGCTELASTACNAGETCELVAGVPTCVVGCVDECVAANFPACSADFLAIETCADTDADGCTELASTACGANEACELVAGAPTCVVQVLQGDTCADPIFLDVSSGSASVVVDNTLFSDSFSEYSCNPGQTGADVWYSFTLAADAGVTIETSAPGLIDDTVMALFSACGGAEVACDDDSGADFYSLINIGLTAGTYYLVMDPYTLLDLGDWTLTVTAAPVICPAGTTQCNVGNNLETCNAIGTAWVETVCPVGCGDLGGGVFGCLTPDTCATAQVLDLTTGTATTVVNNTNAVDDFSAYSCSGSRTGYDVWQTFTLTEDADVVIETSGPGTVTDTVLALFDGCGGTELECDDDDGTGAYSVIARRLPAGTYFVVSEPYSITSRGTWNLTVTATVRAPVTQWNFEAAAPDQLVPNIGTGAAVAGAGNVTAATFPAGNGSVASWSLVDWNVVAFDATRYFQFSTDLTGATSVLFTFDHRRSNTGPTTFELYYSINGTDFAQVPGSVTATAAGGAWGSSTFDLSALLDNQANVTLRIHGYGASGPTGTWRIDNVTFRSF